MTEQETTALEKAEHTVPAEWGDRPELVALANRFKAMIPGKLSTEAALLLAQYSVAMDANPFRGEIYAFEHKGRLILTEGYKLLVRWAERQEPFTATYKPLRPDQLNDGDVGFQCFILRQSDREHLYRIAESSGNWDMALELSTTSAVGVVKKSEMWSQKHNKPIDPPTGWTWEQVAKKRALKNAINFAYGAPSPREIAQETWMVNDTLTIPADWANGTPDMLPVEREALALAEAQRRRKPLEEPVVKSMADLGFGPEPVPETLPKPETAEPADEPPPGPPATAQGEPEAAIEGAPPPPEAVIRGYKAKLQQDAAKARERGVTGEPSGPQRGLMNGMVKKVVGDAHRKLVLAWIYDYQMRGFSTSQMDAAEVKVILDELKPEKIDGRNYEPTKGCQTFKWLARQAQLDAGQQTMEI